MREKLFTQWSAQTLASTVSSVTQDLEQKFGYSVHAIINGTSLNGTIKLEASNIDSATATDWATVADSTQTITALTGKVVHFWNVTDVMYRYIRITWTASSGTGTVTTYINVKGF